MSRDSIYDSVFKTMTQKMPHLLVPLVNYVFGTEFPEDVEVVCMGEEYEGKVKKRIADSVFRIEGRIFHIECQSQWDRIWPCGWTGMTGRLRMRRRKPDESVTG